jgi:organic radical activating enzyme
MNKLIRIISTNDSTELTITYHPTDICNFKCPYCFPGSTPGIFRYPKDLDQVLSGFQQLFDAYNYYKKTKFNLTIAGGGEPTLWPKLDKFCEEVKKLADVKISLVTNGSRTIEWWKNNAKNINEVILSCHVADVDIKHFINVADLLFENNVRVLSMMLMDASRWNECVDYLNLMLESKYQWTVQTKEVVSSPGRDMDSYTPEQLQFLKQHLKRLEPSEIILKNLINYRYIESVGIYTDDSTIVAKTNSYIVNKENFFNGWQCNAPLERIAIHPSGQIEASCGIKLLDQLSLYDVDLQEKLSELKLISCNRIQCDCPPDTHISKKKF